MQIYFKFKLNCLNKQIISNAIVIFKKFIFVWQYNQKQMSFIDKQKNQRSLLQQEQKDKQILLKSGNMKQYEYFFRQCSKIDTKEILKKITENSEFKIHENPQYPNLNQGFRVISIKPTISEQIYEIQVNMFSFYTKLSVLFNFVQTPLNKFKIYAKGSFGYIYIGYNEINNSSYVIKSISVKKRSQLSSTLLNVVKQYTVNSIMSALGIGPKLTKDFGFDIIVYQNSIQFTMELCTKPNLTRLAETQLIQNLAIMHSLQIVHLDIKPENIAYSNFFQRWIFLDFGTSKMNNKQIGYMSLTECIGTFKYSSLQMRNCHIKPGYVDLYYNDVFCLQTSLRDYQQNKNNGNQFNIISTTLDFSSKQRIQQVSFKDQMLMLFKYFIYKEDYEKGKQLFKQFFKQDLQQRKKQISILKQQLIDFLKKIFPSNQLKKFCYKNIHQHILSQKLRCQVDNKFKQSIKFTQNNLQQSELINQRRQNKRQKIKLILYELNTSCLEQNIPNIMNFKHKTKTKNFLQDIKSVYKLININNEEYLTMFFNYVTFQQNKFDAQLDDKREAAKIFIEVFNISLSSFLGYQLSQPQLKELVVCIKFILDYCEKEPWNQMKVQLYPKVCAQFALINPDIFTKKHPKNYLQRWYKIVYEQNNQNLFRMFVKFFKIQQAHKYVKHQDRHIQIQNYSASNICVALRDLWQNNQYFLKHLKNQKLINSLFSLIETIWQVKVKQMILEKKGQKCQFFDNNLKFLETEIISNSDLSKQEKSIFLFKIACNNRKQLQVKNFGNPYKTSFQIVQKIYSYINFDYLSNEILQLCILQYGEDNIFNVKQILKVIDKNINCEKISKKLVISSRISSQYLLGNKMKAVQFFQTKIKQLQNQQIKEQFYLSLISISCLLKCKNEQNKNQQQISTQNLIQKIKNLNFLLMKKLKKYTIKFEDKLRKKQDLFQIKQNEYCLFHSILRQTINYFPFQQMQQKIYFYKVDVLFKHQIFFKKINLPETETDLITGITNSFFALGIANLLQEQKFLELLHLISLRIYKLIQKNLIDFQFCKNLEPFSIYIEIFYNVLTNPLNIICNQQKQLNNYDFNYKDTQSTRQFCRSPDVIATFNGFYSLLVDKFYNYFIVTLNFGEINKRNSPGYQMMSYFHKQQQFEKFFNFIYAFAKYVGQQQNPVTINLLIEQIYLFQLNQKSLSPQFEEYFLKSSHHKQKVWQNPYWWLATSFFSYYIQKSSNKLWIKVIQSFPYMIYEAKKKILQVLYQDVLKNIFIQKNIQIYTFEINKATVNLYTRKMLKLLRQHYKYFCKCKMDLQSLVLIKMNQIKCKSKLLRQIITNKIKKKIIVYFKNIGSA